MNPSLFVSSTLQQKHPGEKAKSADLTMKSSYQEAIAAFKNRENDSIKGIAFLLIRANFSGVGIDHCRLRRAIL